MSFSSETLQATIDNLTPDTAMRMIALAGSKHALLMLLTGLSRNFNATIQPATLATIAVASQRWHGAKANHQVSYSHS